MRIVKPTADDLPAIFELYQRVIDDMHARSLYQWHWGRYPCAALLEEDIREGRLYKMTDKEGLAGVFALCVGGNEPEYRDVDWQLGDNPVCLHRIAVHPSRAGKGYGRQAVDFAKAYGKSIGCDAFRADTYAENDRALRFFAGVTVREAGTFTLEGFDKMYHCFEISL